MIEYIYLVKCPDRTEEPFDFFDEAKDFAIGCLSNNPIITQIEVDRNDFGECTDSRDLGTIWSWEDMVKETEAEPAVSVFTKDDFADYVPETDPEFAALDNTVDFEPDPNNFRKPIPDGMTIKDLVEEMEENEDTVECTWCEDLFDKDECRYELNLGWLCSRCQAAIMSRGETLTFRENNYWDFLDEDTSSKDDLVTESVTLTEAAIYKYPYLAQQPDAVEQLINGLHGYEGLDYYINADCTVKSAPLVYPGGWRNELKSFELLPDGNIRLNTIRRDGQPCVDYLQSALEGLQRSCRGHRILMAIRDVASELERQYTPSLAVRRNISVEQALNDNKDTAKEIINHIINIKFRIPLGTYDTGDVDKNGDPLTDEACDKLERIKDGFLSYRFSDSAVDLGMVEDRTPSEDYTHNITHCWNGVGIITLDCPVNSLSAEAQALIKESQFKKDPEESVEGAAEDTSVATKKAKSNPNTICCYRLACEIIKFADNKPELFKKPEKLVASLTLEELEDADTYRERLTLCPECGGATTFDDETGICINCGFNILSTLTEDVTEPTLSEMVRDSIKKLTTDSDKLPDLEHAASFAFEVAEDIREKYNISFDKDFEASDKWYCEVTKEVYSQLIQLHKESNDPTYRDTFLKKKFELFYPEIEVTMQSAKRDVDDWDEWTETVEYTYEVDNGDVIECLADLIQEEDVTDIEGGLYALENLSEEDYLAYFILNFYDLTEKYEQELLKHWEDDAASAAQQAAHEGLFDD